MYEVSRSKIKKSQVTIEGRLLPRAIASLHNERLKEMRAGFSFPGFRKGRVPEEIFLKHANHEGAWKDAARDLMLRVFPAMIEKMKIRVIGSPKITLGELKMNDSVKFTAEAALLPKFSLPNYRGIANRFKPENEAIEVTAAEVDELLETIAGIKARGKPQKIQIDDNLARSLGVGDLSDLRNKLRSDIRLRKEIEKKKDRREKIAEELLRETTIEIPQMAVDEELANMMNQLGSNLKENKITLEEYAGRIGKTAEAIEGEYRTHIAKQLGAQFILDRIAEIEKIYPAQYEIEQGVEIVRRKYPQAESRRIYEYVVSNLINEKVLEFLEQSG